MIYAQTTELNTLPAVLTALSKGFPAQARSEDALNVMRIIAKFKYPAKEITAKRDSLALLLLQHVSELTRVSQDASEKIELTQAAGLLLNLPVKDLDPFYKALCTLLSEDLVFKGIAFKQHVQVSGDTLQVSIKAIDQQNQFKEVISSNSKSLWACSSKVAAPVTVREFEELKQQLNEDFRRFTDKFCQVVRKEKRALELAMLEKGFTQEQIDLVKSFW